MTGQEIKEKVERFLDVTLRDELILDGINEALNWLGSKSYLIDTILADVESALEYKLPDRWTRVVRVEDLENNVFYHAYYIEGNFIRFRDTGYYRLFVNRSHDSLDTIEEELDLHPQLAAAVLTYVKGFVQVVQKTEKEYGQYLMDQKFKEDATLAYRRLKKGQDTPTSWVIRRR